MPMSRLGLSAGLLVVAALSAVPTVALDATAYGSKLATTDAYASVKDALRLGIRDYNAGDKIGAVRALEFAATQGHALALWKLGRMYADGDGVPQDDLKAFDYFSRIADENVDEAPGSGRAGVVSSALVSLGSYYLDGIKGSSVGANPGRAVELFQYAASYFGDPNAQYHLARLYLEGTGVERDSRQAARWFNLAAEKGHHPAQALLGKLLINGEGVPRHRARGLMWLTIAKEACDPKRDAWIPPLYDQAFDAASESDRRTALAFMEQFQAKRR
jgi:TPR repeat protein